MKPGLDPRCHAFRSDLADAALRAQVKAPRYVDGQPFEIISPIAPLHAAPRPDAMRLTEALCGERFTVFEQKDNWSWGQLASDGYVGYLSSEHLGPPGPKASHFVALLQAHIYSAPDIKSPLLARLPMQARLAVTGAEGEFAALAQGGYMISRHLMPNGDVADDYVAIAERFIGAPYLWGGRSSLGLDCSALVQLSLAAAGIKARRDSDMQATELFTGLDAGTDYAELQRGDLLFWQGHVGIISARGELLHANGYHMMTVKEPLAPAMVRIEASAGQLICARSLRV